MAVGEKRAVVSPLFVKFRELFTRIMHFCVKIQIAHISLRSILQDRGNVFDEVLTLLPCVRRRSESITSVKEDLEPSSRRAMSCGTLSSTVITVNSHSLLK